MSHGMVLAIHRSGGGELAIPTDGGGSNETNSTADRCCVAQGDVSDELGAVVYDVRALERGRRDALHVSAPRDGTDRSISRPSIDDALNKVRYPPLQGHCPNCTRSTRPVVSRR